MKNSAHPQPLNGILSASISAPRTPVVVPNHLSAKRPVSLASGLRWHARSYLDVGGFANQRIEHGAQQLRDLGSAKFEGDVAMQFAFN